MRHALLRAGIFSHASADQVDGALDWIVETDATRRRDEGRHLTQHYAHAWACHGVALDLDFDADCVETVAEKLGTTCVLCLRVQDFPTASRWLTFEAWVSPNTLMCGGPSAFCLGCNLQLQRFADAIETDAGALYETLDGCLNGLFYLMSERRWRIRVAASNAVLRFDPRVAQ